MFAPVAIASLLLAAPTSSDVLVLDLAPFQPFAVVGETIGISTADVTVVGARIDVVFDSVTSQPWFLSGSFQLPTGGAGFASDVLGWSGVGTFAHSFETDAFDGPLAPPDGTPWWTWFFEWSGGVELPAPGGGTMLVPVDGEFTTLSLTLFLEAPCRPDTWAQAGSGLGGAEPAPVLTGLGTGCDGDPVRLALSGAAPDLPFALVLGASAWDLPIFGGVLVPAPDVVLTLFADPSGAWQSVLPFAPALAPGVSVWLQTFSLDVGAPAGIAASNALRLEIH